MGKHSKTNKSVVVENSLRSLALKLGFGVGVGHRTYGWEQMNAFWDNNGLTSVLLIAILRHFEKGLFVFALVITTVWHSNHLFGGFVTVLSLKQSTAAFWFVLETGRWAWTTQSSSTPLLVDLDFFYNFLDARQFVNLHLEVFVLFMPFELIFLLFW